MNRKLTVTASVLVVIGVVGTGLGALTGNLWKTPVSLGSLSGQVTLNSHIKHIDIEIPDANVTVIGTNGNTLRYSGELTALHQKTQEDANQLIRSEWKVQKSGDTLKLYLAQPTSQWEWLNTSWKSAHLQLDIPSAMATELDTTDGSVHVQSMKGDVNVQTSNAQITASNINGPVHLKTSNGKITLDHIMSSIVATTNNAGIGASSIHGSVHLQTSNGQITVDHIKGSVVARTSNAEISATAIDGTVNVHTSDGPITLNNITGSATAIGSNGAINATSSINNTWYLQTSNAHISLSLPVKTNAKLQAATSNASIEGNVQWNSQGSGQGTCILGTGLNQVNLQTSNGSISVNKYEP